jgi:GH15 family glucan-1,4-alpha-glucosidase
VNDALVYRSKTGDTFSDGLLGQEGPFSMGSLWYVECLSRSGDLDKARCFFEKALGYATHLGLYAEELGLRGAHVGNFPQAFPHLALISAAYDLHRRLAAAGQQGEESNAGEGLRGSEGPPGLASLGMAPPPLPSPRGEGS